MLFSIYKVFENIYATISKTLKNSLKMRIYDIEKAQYEIIDPTNHIIYVFD